ncbi:MAG: APC family permease [Ignavibacteriae bacterium]|nr:APC family permease [Ignavibacteriota bacterium]
MEKIKIHKLKELPATAICGNDISSSVLYVSALAIVYAGQFAWVTLLIVGGILFLYRKIYGEVVGALPLNGGAYNALLNTTSKSIASLAATLTLLSYMATAVISANEAMHYLHHLFSSLPIILATIVLLGIFAGLTIMGITESSKVAVAIFIFHLVSLLVLTLSLTYYLFNQGLTQFWQNWNLPLEGSIVTAIFFGFAASMLGISGFESSANFVEEQDDGVFPKTLRNMWIVVSIINPLMAFLALAVVPIPEIKNIYNTTLLSHMGELSAGNWLSIMISIDAVLVLSGAVLTSYVGVSGLLERMSLDRVLPQYFLKKNKRGSSYRIILMFLILSISVLLITNGEVKLLAGVYTISFLSVMTLFGIGNILLKLKRAKLPRPEKAGWLSVFIAIIAVSIALVGNIIMEPEPGLAKNSTVFLEYFIPAMIIIMIMLKRTLLLRGLLKLIRYIFEPIRRFVLNLNKGIARTIDNINSQQFVFFTKGDSVENLNQVMLYIQENEHTNNLKIVTVLDENETVPDNFLNDLDVINREYPKIEIDFVSVKGKFGPELVQELSTKWNIPINFMFIGSPGNKFPYRIQELGGVRLII